MERHELRWRADAQDIDRVDSCSVIALRRATQADVPAISALICAAYTPWIAVMGREPGPMLFDYARAVDRHVIDLHHVGDELSALIQMHVAADHLDIINVAVAPAYQGQGIGRALMDHAESLARASRLPELRLFTNKLMVSNQRLYERLGYTFDREEAFRAGLVVHMSKRL